MLPHQLRFDLRPRRAAGWLKPLLACLVAALGLFAFLLLQPRHAELARLQLEGTHLAGQLNSVVSAAPAVSAATWRQTAEQDGALFAMTLESRLLEIERCTDDKSLVMHIVHDESAGSTVMQLNATTADDVSAVVSCLNVGVGALRWRVSSVETQALFGAGGGPNGHRVTLRRN